MRPNIDIPEPLHYQVKAWATQEDMSVSEAYAWLLREGLVHEGAPPTRQDEGSP